MFVYRAGVQNLEKGALDSKSSQQPDNHQRDKHQTNQATGHTSWSDLQHRPGDGATRASVDSDRRDDGVQAWHLQLGMRLFGTTAVTSTEFEIAAMKEYNPEQSLGQALSSVSSVLSQLQSARYEPKLWYTPFSRT